MKIGLISGEYPPMPGGVGDFTKSLADRMRALGHEVHILTRAGAGDAAADVCGVGGWGVGSLPAIRRWARQRRLDIVNLQYQTAAFDMSPWVHFLPDVIGAPLVTTFHDLRHPYLFPKAGRLRDWIVTRLARASAGIICTNQEDEQSLARIPMRRFIPIGSSVPVANHAEGTVYRARGQLSDGKRRFILGHFGFVTPGKGIDHLLDALANLRAAGHDLRLVFIGERRNAVDRGAEAAYLAALEARIDRLGLAPAVEWTGYLPSAEVAARFRGVDLMALPYTDGASYRRSSLIAAIHCGCAILTTEPALEIDGFAHGENLWLVPPRSSDALEAAILRLMCDGDQLERLRAGAVCLRARFDWGAIARETVAFYHTMLESER